MIDFTPWKPVFKNYDFRIPQRARRLLLFRPEGAVFWPQAWAAVGGRSPLPRTPKGLSPSGRVYVY